VRDELSRETEQLNAVRYHRRALEDGSADQRERQFEVNAAARFAGSLEEAISRFDNVASDGELATEVAELRERLSRVEGELRARDVRSAVTRATSRITVGIGRILPGLDTEWPDDPVVLVPEELTLKVSRAGRDDYLWEVGSGANWLAYHIAITIALHEHFRDLDNSPVPSFVVYDQPSQVYFPKGLPTQFQKPEAVASVDGDDAEASADQDTSRAEPTVPVRDEDIAAVHDVFRAIQDAIQRAEGQWQAIVLDHASSDVWGDIEGIHVVEEWRAGNKLVPQAWLA
jgi:hypothetical protein